MIVTGCPRSGTSLMLHLLAGSVSNYEVKTNKDFKRMREDGDFIIKGPTLLLNKPVRPVIMLRDPRSVLTSQVGTQYIPGRMGAAFHPGYFVNMYTLANGKNFGLMHFYLRILDYLANDKDCLVVRYEDLVSDPTEQQLRVGRYWNLRYHAQWSDYPWDIKKMKYGWEDKLNGIRPIDDGHDWRDHMERVNDVYMEHPELQFLLEAFGYEDDTSWAEAPDGEYAIEPPLTTTIKVGAQ